MNAGRLGSPISYPINHLDGSYVFYEGDAREHTTYHFHQAIEIIYCTAGSGTIFIGNYVQPMSAGDLFLVGKNLPHAVLEEDSDGPPRTLQLMTLRFRDDIVGPRLLASREFVHIDDLFRRGLRGLKFNEGQDAVVPLLRQLSQLNNVLALTNIITIVDVLGKNLRYEFLNSIALTHAAAIHQDTNKINKIYAFTEQHYAETILLEQVAALINFTETSFCRYFKMQAGKSYFRYLTEIRIAHACRILIEDDRKDMEDVCFACGFNNPSTFYKQFKKIVKRTPREYQAQGRRKLLCGEC